MTDDKIAIGALLEKGSDTTLLREMIVFAAERLMGLETETLCNAAPGERSADRINQRNGYRDRDWQARAGTIELHIRKLRRGSYFPAFLEPRRMAGKALTAVIQEALVQSLKSERNSAIIGQFCVRLALYCVLRARRQDGNLRDCAPGEEFAPEPVAAPLVLLVGAPRSRDTRPNSAEVIGPYAAGTPQSCPRS